MLVLSSPVVLFDEFEESEESEEPEQDFVYDLI